MDFLAGTAWILLVRRGGDNKNAITKLCINRLQISIHTEFVKKSIFSCGGAYRLHTILALSFCSACTLVWTGQGLAF